MINWIWTSLTSTLTVAISLLDGTRKYLSVPSVEKMNWRTTAAFDHGKPIATTCFPSQFYFRRGRAFSSFELSYTSQAAKWLWRSITASECLYGLWLDERMRVSKARSVDFSCAELLPKITQTLKSEDRSSCSKFMGTCAVPVITGYLHAVPRSGRPLFQQVLE